MNTETVYCAYCLEPFERSERCRSYYWNGPVPQTCGRAVCKARTLSWNGWLRNTLLQTIRGDVNRPPRKATRVPPFSAKHAALVGAFAETFELREAERLFELEDAA